MGFRPFIGRIADNQQGLTDEFIHLYAEHPSCDDIILRRDRLGAYVYDGSCWRELDFQSLGKAATDAFIDYRLRFSAG